MRLPKTVVEFGVFLRANKKWWLIPLVLMLLLLAYVVFFTTPVTKGVKFDYYQ